MKRFLGVMIVTAWLSGQGSLVQADDKDATPILDKAIAALGGEEKLTKAATSTFKGKGSITFNENEVEIKTSTAVQGTDHHRAEFEMEFNGNLVKGVTILNGAKGWRKFGDEVHDLNDDELASEKHRAYLQAVTTVVPLKGKGFKVEAAGDDKVDGKPAAVVKGTGPDGKSFTLSFDKESGLPVKLTAKVRGFDGQEVEQSTIYKAYKDFDGLKRSTKAETTRDGNPFLKMEMTEFKVLDKPEAGAFDEPK